MYDNGKEMKNGSTHMSIVWKKANVMKKISYLEWAYVKFLEFVMNADRHVNEPSSPLWFCWFLVFIERFNNVSGLVVIQKYDTWHDNFIKMYEVVLDGDSSQVFDRLETQ